MATLTRRWPRAGLMRAWRASRPVHPDTQAALERRWAELPAGVRTDAAHVGNPKRWREDYRSVGIDEVWAQIEAGTGTRLPWAHLQMGDEHCNRSAYGVIAGGRWFALLDDRNPRDLQARERFLAAFGGWTSSDLSSLLRLRYCA